MKAHRLVLVSLMTVAVAALLAGCGGTSKEDYEKEVKAVGKDVNKQMDSFESGQPSAKDMTAGGDALKDAAGDLEDIDPPSEVKSLHEDLIKALRDGGDALGKMAPLMEKATEDPTKLSKEDTDELTKLGTDVQKLGERMDKVSKGFKDKKYDLGLGDEK